ncbi:dihydrofolate reductase family protein [Spirosoma montaniterrae]|uniref:Deaminase n=1 Tax=Spirosoma montaniterrae TaxID=1178516 RepID=A0A1P9WSI8_9BACT|nr:dihydrofolate reductase family protein [Spirosoma montaniterrae]AQG78329.1 deaminase [Spirosoma montaniterrae]
MPRPKTSVYIATSLDGFIARPDGTLDWLMDERYTIPGEDFGYQLFMDSVDTLVMGRNTYETVLGFDEWPYAGKRVVVLSSGTPAVPDKLRNDVMVLSLPPAGVLDYIAQQGGQHVYIDGGQTIQRFLRDKCIDDLIITRMPVLIGEGIPLFGALAEDVLLSHLETKAFVNGAVQSRYACE